MQNLKTVFVSSLTGKKQPPALQNKYFAEALQGLQQFKQIFEDMQKEQYLFDDRMRIDIEAFMQYLVLYTETLICCQDDKVVGVAIFENVNPTRDAIFNGWIAPEYRSRNQDAREIIHAFINEDILDYAW